MAVYSIINKSKLEGASRIDAEYYQPEYNIDFSKGNWQQIGKFLKVCQYGISQSMNNEKRGIPIFKMDDIKSGFLFDDGIKYVPISKKTLDEFKLQQDDVLFNRVNSEEFVGRTGIFKLNVESVFASYLIRMKVDKNSDILPDYLNIFLNSSFGIRQIRKFSRRAVNQANVNAEELKLIRIPIIPKNIQWKLAELTNESWRNYEKSKDLYSQAEDFLLEELGLKDFKEDDELSNVVNLSDVKEAHRMDAEYFQPKYERIIKKIKTFNSELLGNIVSIKKGFEPGSNKYEDEGKLFIRVSSISKHGIIDKDQKYLNNELYQKLKKDFEPKAGEILLTKDATPGIAYVLKEDIEGIISSGILRMHLKDNLQAEYLALYLNSTIGQSQVDRDSGGSIIAHWKPEQIKKILIPVLPKQIQEKITDLVSKSHNARKKAKELLDEAKKKVEEMIEEEAKRNVQV